MMPRGGHVIPATTDHVEELIGKIPDEDRFDIMQGWNLSHDSALRKMYRDSDECLSIMNVDKVVGMFGVLDDGNIWLMRGHDIDEVSIRFVRNGHKYIDEWLERYGKLTGYINYRYIRFIRWLEWEGFVFREMLSPAGDKLGYYQVTKEVPINGSSCCAVDDNR